MSDNASHEPAAESNGFTAVPHDVHVPVDLQTGVTVTKVSAKENKKVIVRIDADLGQIFYQSRRTRISKPLPLFHALHSHGFVFDSVFDRNDSIRSTHLSIQFR